MVPRVPLSSSHVGLDGPDGLPQRRLGIHAQLVGRGHELEQPPTDLGLGPRRGTLTDGAVGADRPQRRCDLGQVA
ncbi:MAG TPA: hypothetical protein VF413_02790, partial [Cellulomonas sp.]